mgnify:CR=1 FL=1
MCLSPITKKMNVRGVAKIVTFPCGHCLECVAKYQNEWSIRLAAEAKQWKHAIFCTLKYGNSRISYADLSLDSEQVQYVDSKLAKLAPNLTRNPRYDSIDYSYIKPDGSRLRTAPVLCKSDVVTLFKRVRANLQYYGICDKDAFKYFVTGEYGPNTLRPHWHAIIFTNVYPPILQGNLRTAWHDIAGDEGDFVHHFDTSIVRDAHAVGAYVSKYCCKPAVFENPYVVIGAVPKPCHLISKGLGDILRQELAQTLKSLCAKYNLRYRDPYELRQQIRNLKKLTKNDVFPASNKYTFTYQVNFMSVWTKDAPRAFYSELETALKQTIVSHGKMLTYSCPRYLRDWCFPQCFYYTTRFNKKKNLYEDVQTLRKDPCSSLALGRQLYLGTLLVESVQDRILELLQTDSSLSYRDACLQVCREEDNEKTKRYRTRLERFVRFYNKGLFKNLNSIYE